MGAACHRAGRSVAGPTHHKRQFSSGVAGFHRCLGCLAGHGEDGALHRSTDGAVGTGGPRHEGTGHGCSVNLSGCAKGVGDSAENLRQDHSGVPTGPHERGVGNGAARDLQRSSCLQGSSRLHRAFVNRVAAIKRLTDRPHRGGHVGAGVAVGNREHVEFIQQAPMHLQGVGVTPDHLDKLGLPQPMQWRVGGNVHDWAIVDVGHGARLPSGADWGPGVPAANVLRCSSPHWRCAAGWCTSLDTVPPGRLRRGCRPWPQFASFVGRVLRSGCR